MDWDEFGGSEGSGESLSGGGSGTGSDDDAAALGMDTQPAEFYDADADDRDEAWVQKMRRSHNSDAILSCPLCFTTLCIDCQQHAKYENQFRAMFVMNCRVKTGEVVAMPQAPGNKKQRRQERQRQQRQQASGEQCAPAAPATGGQQAVVTAAPAAEQQQAEQQAPQEAQQTSAAASDAAARAGAGGAAVGGAGSGGTAAAAGGERLNPVCCAMCDTEVGLRDPADGVYFFFNVFASNS